jgi:hypothetical protein
LTVQVRRTYDATLHVIAFTAIENAIRTEMDDTRTVACRPTRKVMRKQRVHLKHFLDVRSFRFAFRYPDAIDNDGRAESIQQCNTACRILRFESFDHPLVKDPAFAKGCRVPCTVPKTSLDEREKTCHNLWPIMPETPKKRILIVELVEFSQWRESVTNSSIRALCL